MAKSAATSAEFNRRIFDRVADSYTELSLKPAEWAVLARFGDRLKRFEMLDLGVGAGRTGYTFAPLVSRYVGLDYSPRMLERARALLGAIPTVELILGDARDLGAVSGRFDFVLFSFNGIDAVGDDDRRRILRGVRRLLKPDGSFLFSSHSLGTLPLPERKARSERYRGSRLYEIYARLRDLGYGRRVRAVNASLDLESARRRGWTIVHGLGHDFQLDDYYVDPEHQARQLLDAELELVVAYDMAGGEVELPYPGTDSWLHYLCRPAVSAAAGGRTDR